MLHQFSGAMQGGPLVTSADIEAFTNQVLVVLVVFECPLDSSNTFNSLSEMVNESKIDFLIWDNSALAQSPPTVPHLRIQYVHHPDNPGLSPAYNWAATRAHEMRKEWLLFLDQDTTLPQGYLAHCQAAITQNPEGVVFAPWVRDQKGILSPFRYRWESGSRIRRWDATCLPLQKYMAINSGLLVSLSTFIKVGGYNENIPLDFTDISFLKRIMRQHKNLFLINVELQHNFASSEKQGFEMARQRFAFFCKGARSLGQQQHASTLLFAQSLLRAVHLGFQYASMRFIGIHFKSWFQS